jgi:hypothetical protein
MTKTMLHPDYTKYLRYWKQVRIFIEGLDDTQEYLIGVTRGTDAESNARNCDYKKRAKYTNFPARTRNALVGAVFRKEAELIAPDGIMYMKTDVDGTGKPLEQLAKSTVTNVVEIGRHGLYTDYSDKLKRAKIVTYTAENIVDWSVDEVGILIMVKLFLSKDRYKFLLLEDDVYSVEIRNEKDEVLESFYPTDFNGGFFDEIPFTIVGSTDNNPDVDDMPLWSIVDVSTGHYQNSADFEDILGFMLPTPWMSGMTKTYIDQVYPNGFISFGTGAMLPLPPGESAGLLQADENQMHDQAMKRKEEQLLMLGARLISSNDKIETATAAKLKFSAENSVLDNLVTNVSDAIKRQLEFAAQFEGITVTDDTIVYKLNREYFDTTLTAQEITASIMLLDRAVIAKADLQDNLRKTGFIAGDRTNEDIDLEAESVAGGLGAE